MELLQQVFHSIKESIAAQLGAADWFAGVGEQLAAFTASAQGVICLLLRVVMIVLAWYIVLRCVRSLYSDGKDQELWGVMTLVNGARYELRHWESIIGRARYADIRLNFSCVSRSHATLQRDDKGHWLLHPISESSRTNVNGARIHEPTEIFFGDTLSFNGIEMFFFPASAQEIQEQEKRRVRPGGGVSQRKTLWILTVLQSLTLLHFVITTEAERLIKILPAFVLLSAAMWGLYFVYRLFHRAAFELETLAFFLCTVGFSVIGAYAPSSLLKQFVALCIGLVLFLLLSVAMRSIKVAVQCRWPLAAAACALLTFNVLFGQKLFGAKNWISIGPFSFQPSELVKVGIALSKSYRKGGFLKKKTARRMMTPVMDDYGLCLDVWESEARKDSVAGHTGENWGFLTSWVFSRKKDICVAVMYNNVTEAADEAMNDLACEIYKNAKA